MQTLSRVIPFNGEYFEQNRTCFSFVVSILVCRSTAAWCVLSCFDDFVFFLALLAAGCVLAAESAAVSSSRPLLVTRKGNPLCLSFIAEAFLDNFVFAFCLFTTSHQPERMRIPSNNSLLINDR